MVRRFKSAARHKISGVYLLVLFIVFAVCVAGKYTAYAQGWRSDGEALVIDLAQDHVDITTGFTGARLVLFGVREREGDLAIVIRGPLENQIVRRKQPTMGLWMNRESVRFLDVPSYYDYALSAPEEKTGSAVLRDQLGIGLDALEFSYESSYPSDFVLRFEEALIRSKQAAGLFPLEARSVFFLNDRFFRVEFDFPADMPTGDYQIVTHLFKGEKLVDQGRTNLRVAQVGFGAEVFYFAHTNGFFYGLIIVFLAVFSGWAANYVMRRR